MARRKSDGGGGGFTAAEKKTDKSSGGGLGLSVGLGTVGEIEVKGVVDVEISPLSGDVSYDASKNDLSVGGEIGLPGNTVSVGGGVTVDLDTGSISGGSASLGFGGGEVEVNISACETSLQVTYWGVGVSVSKDTCDEGGNDDNKDDETPPPPGDIPPQPNFGAMIPPGYTGSICPAFERQYQSVYEGIWKGAKEDWAWWKEGSYKICTATDWYKPAGWAPGSISVSAVAKTFKSQWNKASGDSYMTESGGFPWREISSQSEPYKLVRVFRVRAYTFEDATGKYTIYGGGSYVGFSGPFVCDIPPEDLKCKSVAAYPQRRPIPPELMSNECCDASISLLRKIAKVLAVDEMLAPLKTSGKILKELEKGIDKVLEDPDLEIEMDNYMELNTFLSLLNNRKVALAVGVDELEFKKDEKNPIFNYLRWCKEYEEGKTDLDYKDWIDDKKKGLGASTTQFKSIPQLILAEMLNSKSTVEVLRSRDIIKTGMEIPNELMVSGGLGFTEAHDYPNIFKNIVKILDLSTVQPFTAILQDADPSKEGDQTLTRYFPDATSAVKEIVELLLENKVDSATRLNIAIRQSILNNQQQVALLETLSIAYTILYGLGLPFHQTGSYFVAPFDISPKVDGTVDKNKKGGKGFNPKNEDDKVQSAINSLNENSEKSTEKLLPDFLSTVKQEYLHTYFDDKKESLWYYVMSVFMKS